MSPAISQQSRTQESSSIENKIISSEESREQIDLLNQLLKTEVQESVTFLVENLPKLIEMVTFVTKSYDTTQSIMKDRVLFDNLIGDLQEFVKPLEEKVKDYAATAIEANERGHENQATTISLFGLLRMLKDPQVQKVFHFVQAYLEIASEKHKKQ